MRAITLCPNCQTQFFVTEAQLEKQNGKVRCGQCLHVFLATEHFISSMHDENESLDSEQSDSENIDTPPADSAHLETSADEADANNLHDVAAPFEALYDATDATEAEVKLQASAAADSNHVVLTETLNEENAPPSETEFLLGDYTPGGRTKKVKSAKPSIRANKYFKLIALPVLLLLILLAIAQTLYFSRSALATFYPKTKPYLLQMCAKLKCTISLPAQIEYVVIDDSDIQEDADYADLMRFSSTLLNRAPFAQQFPNLELTLTDIEDEPKLRRIFKPQEYLPANVNIADGMAPGQEFKIKLAMQAKNTVVSGYRVSINY